MYKKLFIGVVFAIVLFFNETLSHAITIGFDPISQTVPVGSPVTVDLFISGLGDGTAPSLGTFDLVISFDPMILNFSAVIFGPYLGDPLSGEAYTDFLDSGTGVLNVFELSYLDENSASGPFYMPPYLEEMQRGSFSLASLTFDTLALGTSPLNLSIIALGDAWGGSLSAEIQNGSVSAVPEPATILLIASGLMGVAGVNFLKRKRFS